MLSIILRAQVCTGKLMRMRTAVRLNEAIRSRSSDAKVVIVNFPQPPSKLADEENCFLLFVILFTNLSLSCGRRNMPQYGSCPSVLGLFSIPELEIERA